MVTIISVLSYPQRNLKPYSMESDFRTSNERAFDAIAKAEVLENECEFNVK